MFDGIENILRYKNICIVTDLENGNFDSFMYVGEKTCCALQLCALEQHQKHRCHIHLLALSDDMKSVNIDYECY